MKENQYYTLLPIHTVRHLLYCTRLVIDLTVVFRNFIKKHELLI